MLDTFFGKTLVTRFAGCEMIPDSPRLRPCRSLSGIGAKHSDVQSHSLLVQRKRLITKGSRDCASHLHRFLVMVSMILWRRSFVSESSS